MQYYSAIKRDKIIPFTTAVEVRNQIHMGLDQLADSTYSKKPAPFLLSGNKSLYQGAWLLRSQEMATQLGEVRDSPSPELGGQLLVKFPVVT